MRAVTASASTASAVVPKFAALHAAVVVAITSALLVRESRTHRAMGPA